MMQKGYVGSRQIKLAALVLFEPTTILNYCQKRKQVIVELNCTGHLRMPQETSGLRHCFKNKIADSSN